MSLNSGERFVFKMTKSKRIKTDNFIRYLFASYFISDKIVLDAACGSGFGSFFLAQEAKEVWGVDKSEKVIDYAKDNYSRDNIKFFSGDLIKVELPKNFFDVIISFHTFEQTDQPQVFLNNLRDALKDNGFLILATPNKKIVSPFSHKPIGEFHKFEFYKKDLEKLFKNKFKAEWYGQRCASKLYANYFIRRLIRVLEILFNKKFGFYGVRESSQIVPLKFWHEPKDFVIILTKKNK